MARVACVSLDPVNSEPVLRPTIIAVAMPVLRCYLQILDLAGRSRRKLNENNTLSSFLSARNHRYGRTPVQLRCLLGTKYRGLRGNVWFPDPAEVEFTLVSTEVECDLCRGSEYEVLCVTEWFGCDAIISVDNKLVQEAVCEG